MRRLAFATLVTLTIGFTAGGAVADNTPPKPPSPYPMSASAFRDRIDKLVEHMRASCNRLSSCPKPYVESGLTQMKMRTLEACRDGVVTKAEGDWVMSARPTIPMPPNPHPGDGD